MPIYSKLFTDKEILSIVVGNYSNVLIIACGGCMNESVSFDRKMPVSKEFGGVKKHPAIEFECERMKSMLDSHGVTAHFLVFSSGTNSRCIIDTETPVFNPVNDLITEYSPDMVLVLSCPAGFWGINKYTAVLHNKCIPAVQITRQVGMLNYEYYQVNSEIHITFGQVSYF